MALGYRSPYNTEPHRLQPRNSAASPPKGGAAYQKARTSVLMADVYWQSRSTACLLDIICRYVLTQLTLFCLARDLMKETTSKLAAESKPLVGSSRNKILGAVINWLATLTRRFCPPLIPCLIGVPMMVPSCFRRPKESIKPLILMIRSFFVRLKKIQCQYALLGKLEVSDADPGFDRRAAKFIVSLTVKDPIKASSCSTYELIFLNSLRDRLRPLTEAKPVASAPELSRLARKFKRVVFPEPLGPIKAHISPDCPCQYTCPTRYNRDNIRPAKTTPSTFSKIALGCFVARSCTVTVTSFQMKWLTVVFLSCALCSNPRSESDEKASGALLFSSIDRLP